MRLADFLAADRIVVPLPDATLTGAARSLIDRLVATGAVRDPEKLRRRMAEDRAEDIVALTDRAFVLHYRTDAATDLRVALGTAITPVRRDENGGDAGEGEPQRARVVLVIVAPPRQAARQLQVVRGFARLLSRPEALAPVCEAESPEALAGLPLFAGVELAEQLTVRDLMTEHPHTTAPGEPLRAAARQMLAARVSALPVVDDEGRLLGILSERELVRHLLTTQVLADPLGRHPAPPAPGRKHVRDVMTRQVLCVAPEQPLAEVASLMSNKDVERVPVVREGRLVGFLTRSDIVRKLLGT